MWGLNSLFSKAWALVKCFEIPEFKYNMRYLEFIGSTLLFCVMFIIGLNLLFHPELYEAEWKKALTSLSLNYKESLVIEFFGGLMIVFSLLSLFFRHKNFDLVLLMLLVMCTCAIYNPFNAINDERTKINIALIGCILLQRRNVKVNL